MLKNLKLRKKNGLHIKKTRVSIFAFPLHDSFPVMFKGQT